MGFLRRLSNACRALVCQLAQTIPLSYAYDNINFSFKVAKQILGWKDSIENGTCATAVPLFDALPEHMLTEDLLRSFDAAPPLALEDILLTSEENDTLKESLRFAMLRIIVNQAPSLFGKLQNEVNSHLSVDPHAIPLHTTTFYPLPAMDIDESSTSGNAEVIEAIMKEVGAMEDSDSSKYILILWGDQLLVARIRSVSNIRAGHDSAWLALFRAVPGPGVFHYQLTAAGSVFETHWGDPSSWTRDSGSLYFHNTILDRKPISITSPPPYRVCRDLIFVSLYARIYHCLKLVSGSASLEEYAAKVTYEDLYLDAGKILDQYADPKVITKLWEDREDVTAAQVHSLEQGGNDNPKITVGDMVFENAVLFMHDTLILREFTDAIKAGSSGRMVLVLKLYALMLRGGGRTKYAHEILLLLHNLMHIWPIGLR